MGCSQQIVDPDHDSIWMMPCGKPVVRDEKDRDDSTMLTVVDCHI
jgi:hypothetical protein